MRKYIITSLILIAITTSLFSVSSVFIYSLSTIFLFLAALFYYIQNKILLFRFVPIILFFLLIFFSITYTENISLGLQKIETKLPFIIFPILFGLLKNKVPFKLNFIIYNFLFLVLILMLSIIFIYSLKIISIDNHIFFSEVVSKFIHPTYIGLYLILCLSFVLHSFTEKSIFFIKNKFIKLFIVLFFGFFILLLRSRMIFFCYFIILFSFIIYYFNFKNIKIKKGVWFLSIFIIICGISYFGFYKNNAFLNRLFIKDSMEKARNTRLTIWKNSFKAAKKSLLFGYGIGDSQEALITSYKNDNFEEGIRRNLNSHNQFIETIIIAGILPCILLGIILYKTLILYLRIKKFYILGFLISTFIVMNVESIFERQQGVFFFSFFYCFFLTFYDEEK